MKQIETELAAKKIWSSPKMKKLEIKSFTFGDPTISDDGLGDGSFS